MSHEESINITEAEAALYDRQIRLWGLDAQKRLRAASVLLIGLGGLGAEVAKNIVLSGIKSIVLLDHRKVTELDACSQFLVNRTDIDKNRAECSLKRTQQLNPMVTVTADTDDVTGKDVEFFKQFDVVCATCCSKQQLLRINKICHEEKIKFYAGDVNGYYGYMFADLQEHVYAEETTIKKQPEPSTSTSNSSGEPAAKKAKVEETSKTVQMVMKFTELMDAFNVDWSLEDNKKKLKRTPATFFIFRVLLEFRDKFGRDPDPSKCEEDKKSLDELRESVLNNMQVDLKYVDDNFAKYCFAELSPVCAVTGGVLGQEIIKAVSKKDEPHNNFFFYNAVDGSGMVDRLTTSTEPHKIPSFTAATS